MYILGSDVVMNLTLRKSAIHRVTRKMVGFVAKATWEKQAINKIVRIVRSNPKAVHFVCEKEARKFDNPRDQPPYACVPLYVTRSRQRRPHRWTHSCNPSAQTVP